MYALYKYGCDIIILHSVVKVFILNTEIHMHVYID